MCGEFELGALEWEGSLGKDGGVVALEESVDEGGDAVLVEMRVWGAPSSVDVIVCEAMMPCVDLWHACRGNGEARSASLF